VIETLGKSRRVCMAQNGGYGGLLQQLAKLDETGEIQAIEATDKDRLTASQQHANSTNYTTRVIRLVEMLE
jgi:hypothetical protein